MTTDNETVADVADLALLREILGDSPAARMLIELETLRAEKAAHAREVAALQERIDNLEASGVHTCGVHCKRPVCVMRRRAEAAEAAMRTIASTQEGRMAIAKAIHIELDKVDAWIDAAIASGGEDRK